MQDRDAGQGDAGQEMQDRRSNPVEDSRFPQCIDRPRKVVGQQRRGAQSPDSVTALGNRFLRPIHRAFQPGARFLRPPWQ